MVMVYVRLRHAADPLFERGIHIRQEAMRFWWNRLGPMFAADIRRQRISGLSFAHSAAGGLNNGENR